MKSLMIPVVIGACEAATAKALQEPLVQAPSLGNRAPEDFFFTLISVKATCIIH